jgi:uncharacterized membrane protein
MMRTVIYVLAGILLGLAIHLVVILTLPAVAGNGIGARVAALAPLTKTTVIPGSDRQQLRVLGLDPQLAYAICRLDLRQGPGEVSGTLPQSFWSVAVFDQAGTVLYSTTNRDGIGQVLDVGIFDSAQTRLLAEQKIDVATGLLIVEAPTDDVFVLVRLAPPQSVMRDRYEAQLGRLACRNTRTSAG